MNKNKAAPRELTNLEMEAINVMNEDPLGPDITDE